MSQIDNFLIVKSITTPELQYFQKLKDSAYVVQPRDERVTIPKNSSNNITSAIQQTKPWSAQNNMLLNTNKTAIVNFSLNHHKPNDDPVTFDQTTITPSESVKFLGIFTQNCQILGFMIRCTQYEKPIPVPNDRLAFLFVLSQKKLAQ